jgi:DNA-binding NarL/FixJ family response regulator
MTEIISVVIADDTLIAREGWKKILETTNDIRVIGEAKTASETLKRIQELKPDVLLMDLKWFGDETAGWTSIREIKEANKGIRIIAVTAFESLIRDARMAGADSALLKTFTREELLDEIRVQASKPEGTATVKNLTSLSEKITEREMDVLSLLEQGHSDKEIARLLTIAPATAKNHVKRILEKIGAKNRTQAVSIARQVGRSTRERHLIPLTQMRATKRRVEHAYRIVFGLPGPDHYGLWFPAFQ